MFNSRLLFGINALIITILIGFRADNVGMDTLTYQDMYHSIGEDGFMGYPEPLYGYLNYIFYNCGVDFSFFQWCLSVLILLFLFLTIKRYRFNINCSLFLFYALFFVFYAMNITRQILAVVLILYGYSLLSIGCKKKFVVWVLVASFLHYSAIISLFALLIQKINIFNRTYFYGGVILTLLMGVLINESVFRAIVGPYAIYLVDGSGMRNSARLMQAVLLSAFWSTLCIIIYLTSKKFLINSLWFKIYFAGVLLNNMTMNLELGLRIVMYFSISQIIVYVIYVQGTLLRPRILSSCIIYVFVAIFFFVFLMNNSAGILPYKIVLWK